MSRECAIFMLVSLFVVSLTGTLLVRRSERANRQRMLKDRERLSDDAIYAMSFAGSAIPAAAVREEWHRIAGILHVEPGALRPEDRLEDLTCVPRWVLNSFPVYTDLEDLWELASEHAAQGDPPAETIADLVRCFCSDRKGSARRG